MYGISLSENDSVQTNYTRRATNDAVVEKKTSIVKSVINETILRLFAFLPFGYSIII